MNSLSLAFTVVFPLFLMMSLGYVLTRVKLFNDPFLRQLNRVCFNVFLPTLLFINVYESDFSSSFQLPLVLFSLVCVFAMFLLLMFMLPIFEKHNACRGVMIQGMFRSNFILFGLPIASSLFGSSNTGVTAILIAFVVPLYNVLSVFALEYFKEGSINYKRIFRGVITNPLILGALIAFLFILCNMQLPKVLEQTIRDISKIATPLALIILGGSFKFSRLRINLKKICICALGKLVILPLCFITISILLGFRGIKLGALLAMFTSPTAVSSFTMAQQMHADDELAGQIVVITSICSILTLFLWITILSQYGLFN